MIKIKNIEQLMRPIGLMRLIGPMGLMGLRGLMGIILSLSLIFFAAPAAAQKIGGNVYGGGNQGNVAGSTKVTVRAGDIGAPETGASRPLASPQGKLYGGARMANVGGNTYVHIDGEHATDYIVINQVFGGNDIAGQIGTAEAVGEEMPAELTEVKRVPADDDDPKKNAIDNTYNSYVRISTKKTNETYSAGDIAAAGDNDEHPAWGKTAGVDIKPAADAKSVYIGQLFGGGNGSYDYRAPDESDSRHRIYENGQLIAFNNTGFIRPELNKTYLEVCGGSIVYAYGGGNNATVNEKAVIHVNNPSNVVNHILVDATTGEEANAAKYEEYEDNLADKVATPVPTGFAELLCTERFKEMGINTTFSKPSSGAYQVGRFFGGNNLAEMHIRPTWNLMAGKIRNLYSGANKGLMSSPDGLLLDIPEYSTLIADNIYGGCRMGDVMPTVNGIYTPCTNLPGYNFPNELSARVIVRAGHINNVYGGNDVTGTVYGGNAVGIRATVYGDVYGGGNGAYPYTNNDEYQNSEIYGDFYYGDRNLNEFRPNAEQVSIRLAGKGPGPGYTFVKGAIYLGGNCATLDTKKENPLVELKIGSYVIADKVFLGNNGEEMIDENILNHYAGNVVPRFSDLHLELEDNMKEYMEGVCMNLQPSIVFDRVANGDPADYLDNTSYIGSFYCGGNVGSMSIPGKNLYRVDRKLNIFNKFVGGCNNAYVTARDGLNAKYEGGVIGAMDERTNYTDDGTATGNIKDRLEINLENLNIIPLRWNEDKTGLIWNTMEWSENVYTEMEVGTELADGDKYYTYSAGVYTEHTQSGAHTVTAEDHYYSKDFGLVEVPNIDYVGDPTGYANGDYDGVRLMGGNVYGGCYNSGHVNGNIVININEDVLDRDEVFGTGEGPYGNKASGVKLLEQRDDLDAMALMVFGAGHGKDTEVWGSSTVNMNYGYAFQVLGGSEEGMVGRPEGPSDEEDGTYDSETKSITFNGKLYRYDPRYSSIVNLNGTLTASDNETRIDRMAETEYIYGAGKEGDVCGNSYVYLGKGRIYDAFGGACEANILGHTEVYIGRQRNTDGTLKDGFPWIQDIVYGGNDFGGTIFGNYEPGYDFMKRLRNASDQESLHGIPRSGNPGVLKSSTYVEYDLGRVDTIFGGHYAFYNYASEEYEGYEMPYMENSFVNIRPKHHDSNHITAVFGGGTGYPKNRGGDESQDHSYVLIDIPDEEDEFTTTEVFGAGSYNGLGMRYPKVETFAPGFNRDLCSAIIDLLHGEIGDVYGGSFNEGVTARTVVNVPDVSTIKVKNIFGGAYGTQILPPCDVIQSIVNYNNTGEGARVTGNLYGGNNNERRSLFTQVNISSPVWSDKDKGYLAKVYGAGKGIDTWSEHTLVNLLSGAKVYEAYGGGEMGHVLNAESVQRYMHLYKDGPSDQISAQDPYWNDPAKWTLDPSTGMRTVTAEPYLTRWKADWEDAWKLGNYYTPNEDLDDYFEAFAGLRGTSLVYKATIDDRDFSAFSEEEKSKRQYIYNTNVLINQGAEVVNYAYGGGYGDASELRTGDVYGHTYIALLGGTVKKDIYAAGTSGAVNDIFRVGPYNPSTNRYGFTASTTAYVKGGTCRNVYGGGWLGNVGNHTGAISASTTGDIAGETHVLIGDVDGTSYYNGIPTVQRNAYGGGEGGAVYGTAHLKLYNGYVGYDYDAGRSDDPKTEDIDERYAEKTEDDTKDTPNALLEEAGCIFGGGYIDDSSVDKTKVNLYGGHVRNSAFGGGEVAAIGRGDMKEKSGSGGKDFELKGIYRPGKTNIEMYGGHVHRNVFGGGRGYDNLDRRGSLHCDGYVFGQTEVHIHGGEIGTVSGVQDGDGNVFGGCDVGVVYSAYEKPDGTFGKGVKAGARYNAGLTESDPGWNYQGYYYKYEGGNYVTENIYYTQEEIDAAKSGDPAYGQTTSTVKDTERLFTEDCKVLVEPYMKALEDVTVGAHNYTAGEYVTIDDLNLLGNKQTSATTWEKLDQTGIIIHNAVFAGGNTQAGASSTSANTASVFGNATASINDIFHRDMITLGTRHTGGLYGDGNLTLVDGYRELNITNYGTDYHSISKEITIDAYHALPKREADYYELKYTCLKECQDKDGTRYKPASAQSKASTLTADEMQNLFVEIKNGVKASIQYGGKDVLKYVAEKGEWVPNTEDGANFWEESGVLPVYAGRLMNSIQRADFCGVFGSRMVMQGAQDRVPEEADYTNYTINRVREVSLNKMDSKISSDLSIPEGNDEYYKKHRHGNYFGIYNIVNHLGALTSDVDFGDEISGAVRKTENTDAATYQTAANGKPYNTATYYDWKKENINERKRNNGSSYNKLALASGVYLELTTEESTGTGLYEKVWGPVTGVVELDLINVSTGIGGGFVYAQNIHGVRSKTYHQNTTLTALNVRAATKWDYDYDTNDAHKDEWQSSGNFVHSTQTIIDDCYNISHKYKDNYLPPGGVPAHYWYIKGTTYVYDQYISAYTGSANAYSETVDIPLTIAAASHGKMKLLNVMPNRYAYFASEGVELESGKRIVINDKSYYKNDPISYWDWYLLSSSEQNLFVDTTYVNCITCKIDGTEYAAGTYIMDSDKFTAFKGTSHTYTDASGETIKDAEDNPVDADYIFRLSNNVDHDKGYILTYEVDNPSQWDNWYTPKTGSSLADKINKATYDVSDAKSNYEDGPTYYLDAGKVTADGIVLGQRDYKVGDVISKDVEDTYQAIASKPASGQAVFETAYLVEKTTTVTKGGKEYHLNEGTTVIKSDYSDGSGNWLTGLAGNVDEAYICTHTIQVTKEDVIYKDSRLTEAEVTTYRTDVTSKMETARSGSSSLTIAQIKELAIDAEVKKSLVSLATVRDDLNKYLMAAYACKTAGLYGGNYYKKNQNYRGLEAWSSMSDDDRHKFIFNYDALDLLIDKNYTTAASGPMSEGMKYQYDAAAGTLDGANANKAHYSLETAVDYTASYNSDTPLALTSNINVSRGGVTTSTSSVQKDDELSREVFEGLANEQRHYSTIAVTVAGTYYVVNTAFQVGSTPYAVGETISSDTYTSLPTTEQAYVTALTIDASDIEASNTYYYCREEYPGSVTAISSDVIPGAGGGVSGGKVLLGTLISKSQYNELPNQQKNFTIHGVSPTETSTLYVSSESDIYDLSQEKIITVIYQYDYDEIDGSGNVTPISERHVLNIHLTFKSGVPIVEEIEAPEIILPGDFVGLREPNVTPGAYEVTGGGWTLFESERDAESHINGIDYTPAFDPLYWYQNGFYVAYYAKSYLGRTYSNYVPVSVANYHDLADVMSDANKAHHMYIDHKGVKRDSKIYINDYSKSKQNGLDLFKNLYDLSLVKRTYDGDGNPEPIASGTLQGHVPMDSRVQGGSHLEIFLRTDIDHSKKWVNNPEYNPNDPEETDPEFIQEDNPWTPIASGSDPCFSGNFHGDGHTISGLAPATGTTGSLFHKLCGNVYNLGVMGSFTGAGIADTGDGYVESCWVKTSATTPLASKPNAVFGDPTDVTGYQVVNSYFWTGNKGLYANISGDTSDVPDYAETITSGGDRGVATAKSDTAFYNGELAYDLNNFYLYKRYADQQEWSSGLSYDYFTIGDDDKLDLHMDQHYVENTNAQYCSTGAGSVAAYTKYVEDRFADGDFRYAAGKIPDTDDERHWIEVIKEEGKDDREEDRFSPIYPDDYIFFGQKLTYGYNSHAHQEVPTAVVRADGRLSQADDANRVYRAPAYFRSAAMGVAHFNPTAYLAQKSYDGTKTAYPGMTAIDFDGHQQGHTKGAYHLGTDGGGWFYSPLLDDDGLISISNCDETQNLLVYAPAAVPASEGAYANATTHGVLTSYFVDPTYDSYYDNSKGYRLVDECDAVLNGHLVQSNMKATNDHFLVDKQDFNCPLAYSFDADHLMWYQRLPMENEYVDRQMGWQGISLPFTAELVTTHQKGEITHFNIGSTTSSNSDKKIGHEYWLRGLDDGELTATDDVKIVKAAFHYPSTEDSEVMNKTGLNEVTNTFLWDYYYKGLEGGHDQKDQNADTYLQYKDYYRYARSYVNYPLLTAATPYILGLPGELYYEFDLSGTFEARTTAVPNPDKLAKQTISFVSNKGIGIDVSDTEMSTKGRTVSYNATNYYFKPSYMNEDLAAGTSHYTLKPDFDSDGNGVGDCSLFDKVPATGDATRVEAFRPYFMLKPGGSVKGMMPTRILFSGTNGEEFEEGPESALDGTLEIFARGRNIVTRSHMTEPVAIRIVNIGGITVTNFVLEPGQTIETPVQAHGAYIVNKKKVFVR